MLVADWIGGLSLGWWCDVSDFPRWWFNADVSESQHPSSCVSYPPAWLTAVVTNHPEHDPDIQHIPFFAISKDFFGSLWSTYYKRVMAFDGFSKRMVALQ
jgi:delta8-fatty-acid desaturase